MARTISDFDNFMKAQAIVKVLEDCNRVEKISAFFHSSPECLNDLAESEKAVLAGSIMTMQEFLKWNLKTAISDYQRNSERQTKKE